MTSIEYKDYLKRHDTDFVLKHKWSTSLKADMDKW